MTVDLSSLLLAVGRIVGDQRYLEELSESTESVSIEKPFSRMSAQRKKI